jgi:quinoprotein dehydrogenase-associated probable ABC transporter substrate-binding protein
MSSQCADTRPRCKGAAALALALMLCAPAFASDGARVLRVCSDPNNLPFSNKRLEGFENRIADLLARDMAAKVQYTWWAQRRGFFRNTLNASKCDVVLGVPSTIEMARTTRPYYRSSYVFAYRKGRGLQVRSFDDPALRKFRIGVQMVGDDYANTPPAHALAMRGIVDNVKGYTVYGDYSKPNPSSAIMDALASGAIDIAVVWGPIAGYYSKTHPALLELVPVWPQVERSVLPFAFDISMGVRRADEPLSAELERILRRRAEEVRAILQEFGVPIVGR